MTKESKESFGVSTPIGRAGQPVEIATCFVFLAGVDSSFMRYTFLPSSFRKICITNVANSGQVLHPNGGVVIA